MKISVFVMALLVLPHTFAHQDGYVKQVEDFRKDREASLTRERGWLSVAGLTWLSPGDQSFGSSKSGHVVFRKGSSLPTVGTLSLGSDGKVTLKSLDKDLTVSGKPVSEPVVLADDSTGKPDLVKTGEIQFRIIKRGGRTGVRWYDSKCPGRLSFTGLHWYPVNPKFNIKAKFVPYNPTHRIYITNILGDTEPAESPGYASFMLDGKEIHLDAVDEGETFFINFRDLTSGHDTYPAGRFLDAPRPVNGEIELDFNKAYNPPCAFTKFATCPLPVANNRLRVAIPAGELAYHVKD